MQVGDVAAHGGVLIAQGAVASYDYKIFELEGYRFNDTRATGPITLDTRLQLYRKTLPYVVSGNYFGMLDNSEGFENDFDYNAIKRLDDFLMAQGLKTYYGATVAKDAGYGKVIKLAQANMDTVGLPGELVKVPNRAAALEFVIGAIRKVAAIRKVSGAHDTAG